MPLVAHRANATGAVEKQRGLIACRQMGTLGAPAEAANQVRPEGYGMAEGICGLFRLARFCTRPPFGLLVNSGTNSSFANFADRWALRCAFATAMPDSADFLL